MQPYAIKHTFIIYCIHPTSSCIIVCTVLYSVFLHICTCAVLYCFISFALCFMFVAILCILCFSLVCSIKGPGETLYCFTIFCITMTEMTLKLTELELLFYFIFLTSVLVLCFVTSFL